MSGKTEIAPVRILADDVINKIAAGEVVERPASVVKELVENALDAGATRVIVRTVAAGRRLIEVVDNGHGMSEPNALLAIERHATSKMRKIADLESVRTMGFRGEALASVASVSRFELLTRREQDPSGTRIRMDGGILRDVEQVGAPPGTRVTVNRLYFNTPVREKFLKGITTELGHCIDVVQRHALARADVGFQFWHNDKLLLDIPEHATLRERVALIWGLSFVKDMIEIHAERAGFTVRGIIGLPGLTRAARSHQIFLLNRRPVVNRALQYGFEEGYRGLITIGRYPVGVLLLETHPRFVDVNIHPTKREIRFRDERAVRDLLRDIVRDQLSSALPREAVCEEPAPPVDFQAELLPEEIPAEDRLEAAEADAPPVDAPAAPQPFPPHTASPPAPAQPSPPTHSAPSAQTELPGFRPAPDMGSIVPEANYASVDRLEDAPLQIFDTYLVVPTEERLLIIDQHALHERLNYDNLLSELQDKGYESQQLAVPIVFEVAPSQVRLVERHLSLFRDVGIEIEPFGGNTFQVTSVCHLYEDSKIPDVVYAMLDELGQGDLFNREHLQSDVLRLATRACKQSVKAGDRLTPQERRHLLDGFRRLRPPYTCPHGRPIIIELTQHQVEKSFRRIQ